MKDIFFERRGIHYRFNDFDHSRPTLVFIHGISGSSAAWDAFVERLETDYNLLIVDLRGHGRSQKFKRYRDYNCKEFANDIYELLAHLDIERPVLVSHSFGTLVALEYLINHPRGARAAVFLSPNYGIHRTPRARITWPFLAFLVRVVDILPVRIERGARLDYHAFAHTGDWNVRRMVADIRSTTMRTYLYCLEHAYRFNRDSWWNSIHIPVLVVHGKQDTVIPVENARMMARSIPHCELVLLDDADHMLVLNNADKVVPFIKDFVAQQEEKDS